MLKDVGILNDSIRYYHDADIFTEENLFYIPHAGTYHCNAEYIVRRDFLEVCQIIIIDKGELTIEYDDEVITVRPGMTILMDCRRPHVYYSACDNLKMRWFHFTGHGSEAYTKLINETHGFVLNTLKNHEIEVCISFIMALVKNGQKDPHLLSFKINNLLLLLYTLPESVQKTQIEQTILKCAEYINKNCADESLDVKTMAKKSALSQCYFMRKFKEYTGATPHKYIQGARLRAAKQLLMTTSGSIEEIALECGFCSSSHFISCFRADTGQTPHQFRNHWK